MRYWPVLSVTTDRTRSIKAGLAASTVTPGSTDPDVSRAVPVMVACADAMAGIRRSSRKQVAGTRTRCRVFTQIAIRADPPRHAPQSRHSPRVFADGNEPVGPRGGAYM